jgi:GrpB-like predicted nucleotidyltransferase (UPF0157 family)
LKIPEKASSASTASNTRGIMLDTMGNIGLKRGTVKLVPHDPEWDGLFQAEKAKLLEALGDLVLDIQHIGSTAIPTISAKPIIDVAVLVKSIEEVCRKVGTIEALEYQKKQEDRPERLFFTKGPEDMRIVYLHIGDKGTNYIQDMIAFRDYLIQNPGQAKKYMDLKNALAEQYANDRETYTAAKENFVRDVLKKANKPT